jgi:hypothetical protein
VLLLAGLMLVSGCGGVPTSSQVQFTDSAPLVQAPQYIRVIAQPPADDMEPTDLVRGFLDACADPSNDFEVARQYLTAPEAVQWNPDTGVQVYDPAAGLDIKRSDTNVVVSTSLQATVSPDRHFALLDQPAPFTMRLTLVKDSGGQWRINDVPDGILLSTADADRTYRAWSVYFVTSDLRRLVTSSIVLPQPLQGTATALVQSLLAGPATDLAGVATTAFPSGTKLTYGSVPVANGIAEVDLTADVLVADRSARRALTAQLVYTLSQLPAVSGVRLTVSGQQLTVPGTRAVTRVKDWLPYQVAQPGSVLYVAGADGVQRWIDGQGVAAAQVSPDLLGVANLLAVDGGSGRIAAVFGSGTQLATTGEQADQLTLKLSGVSLSRPTWDRDGNAYVADFGSGVSAVPLNASPYPVEVAATTWGGAKQVKQVAVAPDGVQVAVVMSTGTADVMLVGSLVRNKSAVTIDGLHRVDRGLGSVRDMVWTGPLTLLVLLSDAASQSLLSLNIANGQQQPSAAPPGAQSLAVDASGAVYVVVAGSDGASVAKRGFSQWTDVAAGTAAGFGP